MCLPPWEEKYNMDQPMPGVWVIFHPLGSIHHTSCMSLGGARLLVLWPEEITHNCTGWKFDQWIRVTLRGFDITAVPSLWLREGCTLVFVSRLEPRCIHYLRKSMADPPQRGGCALFPPSVPFISRGLKMRIACVCLAICMIPGLESVAIAASIDSNRPSHSIARVISQAAA